MCDQPDGALILTSRGTIRAVDTCLRGLVQFLNDIGVNTYDSCCGHGGYGHITIGEEDVARVRALGFRVCTDNANHRACYPFAAVDHRINIILPPPIKAENASDN